MLELRPRFAVLAQREAAARGGGASGGGGSGGGGGRRGRLKPLSELHQEWEWLTGIAAEDRSWLHFALYHGYEAQARLVGAAPSMEQTGNLLPSALYYGRKAASL